MKYNYNGFSYILRDEASKVLNILVEKRIDELTSEGKILESVGWEDVFNKFLELYGGTLVEGIVK